MTTRITISLPKSVEEWVRMRVSHGGYGSMSDYFRELVRIDQRFELSRVQRGQDEAARRSAGGSRFRP